VKDDRGKAIAWRLLSYVYKMTCYHVFEEKTVFILSLRFVPTMGDKSVETLDSKIRFSSILDTCPPLPPSPKQCWFFYFLDCTDHSTNTTLNWGAGSIRESMLDANNKEQVLKYQNASFPKSVSTTFVAHCSLQSAFCTERLNSHSFTAECLLSCIMFAWKL